MNVVAAYPPNYEQIVAAIPAVRKNKAIVFTYGDTLYAPSNPPISDHLMAHEETHAAEQARIGIDKWWKQYLAEPRFRLEQELLAYKAQYKVLLKNHPRHIRRVVLLKISADLGGSMYGGIVDKEMARKLITGGVQL